MSVYCVLWDVILNSRLDSTIVRLDQWNLVHFSNGFCFPLTRSLSFSLSIALCSSAKLCMSPTEEIESFASRIVKSWTTTRTHSSRAQQIIQTRSIWVVPMCSCNYIAAKPNRIANKSNHFKLRLRARVLMWLGASALIQTSKSSTKRYRSPNCWSCSHLKCPCHSCIESHMLQRPVQNTNCRKSPKLSHCDIGAQWVISAVVGHRER